MGRQYGEHRDTAGARKMVVVFTIVTFVMFFMVIRMLVEIDMVVPVMPAVGAMVDDHRCGLDFIDRKDRHAEDHENTKASLQRMTGMVLTAIFPGFGMVVAMFRTNH